MVAVRRDRAMRGGRSRLSGGQEPLDRKDRRRPVAGLLGLLAITTLGVVREDNPSVQV
jgi:hypothetical protein